MKHVLGGWWCGWRGPGEVWRYKTDLGQLVGEVQRQPSGSWRWAVKVPPRIVSVLGLASVVGQADLRLDAMKEARAELRRLSALAAVPLAQLHKEGV